MVSSLLSAYSERFLMKTYGISSGPELLLVRLINSEYSSLVVDRGDCINCCYYVCMCLY